MFSGLLVVLTFALIAQVQGYCQPNEPCWPTQEEIEVFASSLTSGNFT
jgi:hypothetical protein